MKEGINEPSAKWIANSKEQRKPLVDTISKRLALSNIRNQPVGKDSLPSTSCCTKCTSRFQCLENLPVIFDCEGGSAVLTLSLWFVWNHGCNMDDAECVDTCDSNSPQITSH